MPKTLEASKKLVSKSQMISWSMAGPMLMPAFLPSGAIKAFSGELTGPETSLPVLGSSTSQSR